ncbi:hypothetical protein VDG1235_1544 [Verrucomicrobiia bacterium DG1235]|nr:hypothetical protein VDG1235_1544 [Verrucomicrobiae bacterium DG1235]
MKPTTTPPTNTPLKTSPLQRVIRLDLITPIKFASTHGKETTQANKPVTRIADSKKLCRF